MSRQSIQDLMTSHPVVCTPEDPILEVARRLRDANVGSLPVVDHCDSLKLVGIITDRDIVCRVVAAGQNCGEARVRDAMSTEVSSLTCEDTVNKAVLLMSERQVRRLPVVDAEGRVIGIVAQADLAEAARQQGDLEDELAEVVEEISEPSTRPRAG